uniref:Ovule protein n=1 Tax=Steinernema glaseri TaxID=37863 RepID=A0A1I8ALI5_9BILA
MKELHIVHSFAKAVCPLDLELTYSFHSSLTSSHDLNLRSTGIEIQICYCRRGTVVFHDLQPNLLSANALRSVFASTTTSKIKRPFVLWSA